jgi:hypothetical protein
MQIDEDTKAVRAAGGQGRRGRRAGACREVAA